MQCLGCNFDNLAGNRFCEQCGTRLEARCNECGAVLRPTARFCGACGTPVVAAAGPAAQLNPQLTPREGTEVPRARAGSAPYTPKHLAEKILNARSAMQGERRQVTVLFADLAGFTSLAAGRDPE